MASANVEPVVVETSDFLKNTPIGTTPRQYFRSFSRALFDQACRSLKEAESEGGTGQMYTRSRTGNKPKPAYKLLVGIGTSMTGNKEKSRRLKALNAQTLTFNQTELFTGMEENVQSYDIDLETHEDSDFIEQAEPVEEKPAARPNVFKEKIREKKSLDPKSIRKII